MKAHLGGTLMRYFLLLTLSELMLPGGIVEAPHPG
jgi:hypothetical protein